VSSAVDERSFQDSVAAVAQLAGWRVVHFRPARRADGSWRTPGAYDAAGFPDLTLARAPRLVYAELKSEHGRLSDAQKEWLALLAQVPGVETYLWRPSDWPALTATLTSETGWRAA